MNITNEYIDFGGTVYFYHDIDKMQRTKENAFLHGLSMFCRSWTFERMTANEKTSCVESLLWANRQGMIKGTFCDRINIMNAVYHAFLCGIGYTGAAWREAA